MIEKTSLHRAIVLMSILLAVTVCIGNQMQRKRIRGRHSETAINRISAQFDTETRQHWIEDAGGYSRSQSLTIVKYQLRMRVKYSGVHISM